MDDAPAVPPMPDRDLRAMGRTAADAAVASIPGIGGAAQVLLTDLFPSALTKRRDDWLRELAEVVNRLVADGVVDVEQLASDPQFVSAVVDASRIALGTHLEDKIDLLKRALLHVALDPGRDDFVTSRLLQFIDELATEHFVLLTFATRPGASIESGQVPRPQIVFEGAHGASAVGDLGLGEDVFDLVVDDLQRRKLINAKENGRLWSVTLTPLGSELMALVDDI